MAVNIYYNKLTRKHFTLEDILDIKPLNAIVYNQEKVNINDVIAPPYDVITSAYQDELYKKSPYNIVRLILTKGEKRY